MRTGIMGGTFNPPHYGHLYAAEQVRQALELDKVLFIPTNLPPHKKCRRVRRIPHNDARWLK